MWMLSMGILVKDEVPKLEESKECTVKNLRELQNLNGI